MSISTLIDFNFGRSGNTSRTYINNEMFKAIDFIAGWNGLNDKIIAETNNGEQTADIVKGRSNYLRTCLETNYTQNTIYNRANSYPFCFSNDVSVLSTAVGLSACKWRSLPRFTVNGTPSSNGVKVGFQNYICPKSPDSVWPNGYWSLAQTKSNSNWPIRPSNGDGAAIEFSPPKPYHTRIRIKLTDLKWNLVESETGAVLTRNILENDSVAATSDERLNGEIVLVTKVRGFINLINPDATNATTNSSGKQSWPHNFNQIYYRVTTDEFGGDSNTPLLTIMNSECAGNSNLSGGQLNRSSSYYGDGIPFEVPVLENQRYLIFDIYTDVCDNTSYQTAGSTQWWQMTWSFESCMYRPVETSGDLPTFHVETNPQLSAYTESSLAGWPRENYYFYWDILHGLGTQNISVTLYNINGGKSVPVKCESDVIIVDNDNIRLKIRTPNKNDVLPIQQLKAFLIGGNKLT